MAGNSTIYDVKVRYSIADQASRRLSSIGSTATKAATSTGKLRKSLDKTSSSASRLQKTAAGLTGSANSMGAAFSRLGGILAATFSIQQAGKHLIGYNMALEQTHASLRTIIQMNSGGKLDFAGATREASVLMAQLKEDAKKSAGTFQDMAVFASAITAPITQLGGTLGDVRSLTRGAVVAAASLGERADVAQLDVKQMLQGAVGARDRMATLMLGSLGLSPAQWNEFVRKAKKDKQPQKIVDALRNILTQKSINDAAKAYETSFSGVFSTFQSNLQEFGGTAGKLLFQSLNTELIKINAWFDKNPDKIKRIGQEIAATMRSVFVDVKNVFSFIAEHKDTLILLAKAMLIAKGAGMLGNMVSAAGTFAGSAKMLAVSISTAALLMARSVDKHQESVLKKNQDTASLRSAAARFGAGSISKAERAQAETRGIRPEAIKADLQRRRARTIVDQARQMNLISAQGVARRSAIMQMFPSQFSRSTGMMDQNQKNLANTINQAFQLVGFMKTTWASAYRDSMLQKLMVEKGALGSLLGLFGGGTAGTSSVPKSSDPTTIKNLIGDVNVDKMTVNVQADDPTRFVMALRDAFGTITQSPSQAISAVREGLL